MKDAAARGLLCCCPHCGVSRAAHVIRRNARFGLLIALDCLCGLMYREVRRWLSRFPHKRYCCDGHHRGGYALSWPAPPRPCGNVLPLHPQICEYAVLKPRSGLAPRELRQCRIELAVELVAIRVRDLRFVVIMHHALHSCLLSNRATSFSFKICRARNTRDRTAASLIPSVAATSRGDISSTVDKINDSRSFVGNVPIIRASCPLTSALCIAWSADTPDDGISFAGLPASSSGISLLRPRCFLRSTATLQAMRASQVLWFSTVASLRL